MTLPITTRSPILDVQPQAIVRGTVQAIGEGTITLAVPYTDYHIRLTLDGPITTPVGKRIRGIIHASALRMFKASGGGRFIEPIAGAPRIVAGLVLAVDVPQRRVLVDVAVPMWMTLEAAQAADMFNVGDLVNCYVESGTRFTPV